MPLRVTNWIKHYETYESRKLLHLEWVKTPNSHDSVGFCEFLSHPNGMAHYGAWNLILQLASKCPVRGLLVTGKGKNHDAHSIALVTRGNEKIISEAIARLLEIGWLEESAELPAEPPEESGEGRRFSVAEERRGEQIREREEGEESPPATPGTDLLVKALKATRMAWRDDALEEWIALTVNDLGCETDEESAEAVSWLSKTAKRDGKPIRWAREAECHLVAGKCHMQNWREKMAKAGV